MGTAVPGHPQHKLSGLTQRTRGRTRRRRRAPAFLSHVSALDSKQQSMMWLKRRLVFCSQRLLGAEMEDASAQYSNYCFLGVSIVAHSSALWRWWGGGRALVFRVLAGRWLSFLQGQLCACCRVTAEPAGFAGWYLEVAAAATLLFCWGWQML